MKRLAAILLACSFLGMTAMAVEPTSADQKWAQQVKKLIVKGPTTISTTQATRVQLAKAIASEQKRPFKVTKVGKTWRIEVGDKKTK